MIFVFFPFSAINKHEEKMNTKIIKLSLPLVILMVTGISILTVVVAIPVTKSMGIVTLANSFNADNITPEELKVLQKNHPDSLILIDVRSPQEYQQGHIEGSILIPLPDIEANFGVKQISKLVEKHQNSTIVVYCTRGYRSTKAHDILAKNGIKTVNLEGGIEAWYKLN